MPVINKKRLKVIHLNTYDGNGGAGRAVLRLNQGLKLLGIDSQVICLYQFNPQSGVTAISNTFIGRIKAVFNILAERFLIKPFLKGKQIPFSLQRFGISPSTLKVLQDADVIHIHWINHGFLSPSKMGELAQLNKKIFWTLHDSNPITGGCHVRYGCTHFKQECGACPALKNPSANDLSHRTWLAKSKAYQEFNFTFIAPSIWMGRCALEASLSANKQVRVISNALETDIFKPLNKVECRAEFGIDPRAQVILAGYMPSESDRHKGLLELIEAITHLLAHPGVDKGRIILLFYGSNAEGLHLDIPIPHRFMGKISSDLVLVKLYSLSDVFVFPSLEESMGYTALESLSCGTPVVAFRTSGVTDIVQHGINGYLAPLKDTKDLANGIYTILNNPDYASLSLAAREWASENFNLQTIAQKHSDLYHE
ncbi:glycosyltransferase [Arcticibacter eurypsychrophilus]|uniref:glycosyltransferase n=1 Tax=Arcticibacter eurypsychrophilus TaxID=1434752 RepID=UPI0009F63512|nr:glycosyltransferase [Arcticibacter eurypsychrophilus]